MDDFGFSQDRQNFTEGRKNMSMGEAFAEAMQAFKDMMQSERELMRAEFKHNRNEITKYAKQTGIYGGLASLSVLPFVAFLVIGLGRLLEDNYWLSSLIVGVVFAGVGGLMARRAYNRIKELEMMPQTRDSLNRTRNIVMDKFQDVKGTAARRFDKLQKERRRGAA